MMRFAPNSLVRQKDEEQLSTDSLPCTSNPSDPSITDVNRPGTSGSSRLVSIPAEANNSEADITDVNCPGTSGSSNVSNSTDVNSPRASGSSSHASNPNHSETSIPDLNSSRTSDIRTDSEESDQFNL